MVFKPSKANSSFAIGFNLVINWFRASNAFFRPLKSSPFLNFVAKITVKSTHESFQFIQKALSRRFSRSITNSRICTKYYKSKNTSKNLFKERYKQKDSLRTQSTAKYILISIILFQIKKIFFEIFSLVKIYINKRILWLHNDTHTHTQA